MREHHVYVLPSTGGEGWGMVINEAMGEGCAFVGSDSAGASRTMVRNGENGLLFPQGDVRRLAELLCELSTNHSLRLRLASEGQSTIVTRWSPAIAASRLASVCDSLLSGRKPELFDCGPMSPAWKRTP
jgi:glycosyltransferase involved in cell wall biosynthesis